MKWIWTNADTFTAKRNQYKFEVERDDLSPCRMIYIYWDDYIHDSKHVHSLANESNNAETFVVGFVNDEILAYTAMRWCEKWRPS